MSIVPFHVLPLGGRPGKIRKETVWYCVEIVRFQCTYHAVSVASVAWRWLGDCVAAAQWIRTKISQPLEAEWKSRYEQYPHRPVAGQMWIGQNWYSLGNLFSMEYYWFNFFKKNSSYVMMVYAYACYNGNISCLYIFTIYHLTFMPCQTIWRLQKLYAYPHKAVSAT